MTGQRRPRPPDPPPAGQVSDLTAERAIVAALLTDPASTLAVLAEVGVEAADLPTLGPALGAARRIVDRGEPLDIGTLAAELTASNELAGLGGVTALLSLGEQLADPRPDSVRFYGTRLREVGLVRRITAAAGELGRDPGAALDLERVLGELRAVREGGPSRRLVALDVRELLAMEVQPRPFLLSPWLRAQDLVMLYAPRGVGKTALAASVAAAVAGAGSLMHWRAEKPRRTVYVDAELPLETFRHRVATAICATDCDPSGNLLVLPSDLQPGGFRSITEVEGQRDIEAHLDGAELLVLDNVSTLCRGGEENAAESWESVQAWLLSLRRRGLAVVLLHHAGRNGLQRGTSKREDILDTIIKMAHPDGYQPEQGARFRVTFEKARSLTGAAVQRFEAALDDGPDGRPVWTYKLLGEELAEQVSDLHEAGLSVSAIARELGRNKGTVSKVLRRIKEGGVR